MPITVTMPQMGESVVEGTIERWLVQEGDRVEKDQILCEVSTDKVDAEIPAPYSEDQLKMGLQRVVDFVEDAVDVSIGLSIFAGLNLVSYEKTQQGKRVDATHIADGNLILDGERDDDYTPEELAGRTVVMVANLKPVKLMGVESQGMLLAAEGSDGLKLVGVEGEVPPGAKVR